MDLTGLLLLLGLFIIGGGLYLASRQPVGAPRKLPPAEKNDDTFETAEDVFPLIEFPPEPEQEYVPDVPNEYNDNNITLMARDPETMHAYWEVSGEKINELHEQLGNRWDDSKPVIRVHDITGVDFFDGTNAHGYHDEEISEHANSWYLNTGMPDRTYCAELGRRFSNGDFVVIARSNYTYTPRNSLSDRIDQEWMLISENERRLYGRIGQGDGASSYNLFKR